MPGHVLGRRIHLRKARKLVEMLVVKEPHHRVEPLLDVMEIVNRADGVEPPVLPGDHEPNVPIVPVQGFE